MTRKLAFLSGAPRTSTKPIATLTGGRQHILGTINGFEANGWQVDRWIVGDKVPEKWLEPQHEMSKGKSFARRLAADVLRVFLSLKNVREALKEISEPEWVYERYAAYQLFGYFFQRRGAPWILETNSAYFLESVSELRHVALPALVSWGEKFAYSKCDILVVISDELKRIISERLQIPAEKIVVVPNAADTEAFNPHRVIPRRLFGDDTFVVGFQGGMYTWAGLDYLLRAVAALRKQGLDVAAVLLGDGHERHNLGNLAAELGVVDYVRFPGRVGREEVPQYIAGYDLCYSGQVNLSNAPMYLSPLKLYDYMAMGKPVLAAAFADAVKVTKNGELGYLFKPESLEDLISATARAFSEREKLVEMGVSARAEILANHTWPSRIRDFIATAETMLAKHPSRRLGPCR